MRFTKRPFVVLVTAFLVAGCGRSGYVKAKGRLVKGGEPFLPPDDEIVHVAFFPAGNDSSDSKGSFEASFDRKDGTFQVLGKDGNGLPPGKYRVVLQVLKNRKDQLKGACDVKNSPFVCEVNSTSSEITLDLATATKQAPAQAQPTARRSKK